MIAEWRGELVRSGRGLISQPGTAVVAILSLAAGIGVTTTAFSLLNVMALRELPGVVEQARLVTLGLEEEVEGHRRLGIMMSPGDVELLADRNRVFSGVSGAGPTQVAVEAGGEAIAVPAEVAFSDYFRVLGTAPAAGRFFVPEEDAPGAAVVVLSHRFWREHGAGLGGDTNAGAGVSPTNAPGHRVRINGEAYTIVGVAPEGFTGMVPPDVTEASGSSPALWLPMGAARAVGPRAAQGVQGPQGAEARWLRVVARLGPGVTVDRMASSLPLLAAELERRSPERVGVALVAGDLVFGPGAGRWHGAAVTAGFLVVPILVLLIAAANAANLLLARSSTRRRELAVRAALGATRASLVRPVVGEGVLLALVAGVLGLGLAFWSADIAGLFALHVERVPLDLRVFAFTLVVAVLAGSGSSLIPALRSSRAAPAEVLKGSGRAGEGLETVRFRRGLVIGQVTLSVVLLVVSGLFVRSVGEGLAVKTGLGEEGLVLVSLDLGVLDYDGRRGVSLWEDLLAEVRMLPGVRAAELADQPPLAGLPPVRVGAGTGTEVLASLAGVGPAWFEAAGVPLLGGTAEELARSGSGAVVVSRSLAERLWPGLDPLGRPVRVGDGGESGTGTVVAVAADMRQRLHAAADPTLYTARSAGDLAATLYVRSDQRAEQVAVAVRQVVRRLDPALPVQRVETASEVKDRVLLPWRLLAGSVAALGAIALALSVAGLYGIISFNVARRAGEIGVRMALGATRAGIVGLVLRQALGTVGTGLAIGCALAAGVATLVRSLLFGVSPLDPVTFAAIALILLTAAAVAAAGPARWASSIEPVRALGE